MSGHQPKDRLEATQVLMHNYLADLATQGNQKDEGMIDLERAVKNMQQLLGYDSEPAKDENLGQHIISDFDPQKEEEVRIDDERFEKLRQSLLDEVNLLSKRVRIKNEVHLKVSKQSNFAILKEVPDDQSQKQTVKPEKDDKWTKTEIEKVCHLDKSINPTTEQQQQKEPVAAKTKEEKFLNKSNLTPSIN